MGAYCCHRCSNRLRSGARVRFPGESARQIGGFFVQLRSERAKRLRCVPLRSSNESKSSDLVCTSDRTLCTSHRSVMYNRKAERRAGVVQWQYRSFPSFGRGFDSHRPLQILKDLRGGLISNSSIFSNNSVLEGNLMENSAETRSRLTAEVPQASDVDSIFIA